MIQDLNVSDIEACDDLVAVYPVDISDEFIPGGACAVEGSVLCAVPLEHVFCRDFYVVFFTIRDQAPVKIDIDLFEELRVAFCGESEMLLRMHDYDLCAENGRDLHGSHDLEIHVLVLFPVAEAAREWRVSLVANDAEAVGAASEFFRILFIFVRVENIFIAVSHIEKGHVIRVKACFF